MIRHNSKKHILLFGAFVLLAAAAILGAVAHAVCLTDTVQKFLWYLLYLLLKVRALNRHEIIYFSVILNPTGHFI